jgi:hypothetical protein
MILGSLRIVILGVPGCSLDEAGCGVQKILKLWHTEHLIVEISGWTNPF